MLVVVQEQSVEMSMTFFGVGSKRDGMKRNLGEGVHDLYSP